MRAYLLHLLVGMMLISVSGDLAGQVEKDPSKIYFINLEGLITQRVKDQMSEWLVRGEFEKSADYYDRVAAKDEQVKKFTQESIDFYMQQHIEKIDFDKYFISDYDADRETFKITVNRIGDIILPVPLHEAMEFKEGALRKKLTFYEPDFVIRDNSWVLSYLKVACNEREYAFDIKNKLGYNPQDDFLVEMDDLNIRLPQSRSVSDDGAYTDYTNKAFQDLDDEYDIGKNLPRSGLRNNDAIAVVIGNRNYDNTKRVDFAIRDALRMQQYLVEVLGFRPENVLMLRNARKGDFDTYFGTTNNHKGKLFNYVKPGQSDVFVFYSGHGAPGLNDKEGYFVPVECDPNNVELGGYSLNLFYKNLAKIPARSKTVVIDACFSGAELLRNVSPIGIRIRPASNNDESTIVLTSSEGTQLSTWYNAKQHGLFTYFFLKAIHEREKADTNQDKQLTYKEIFDYINSEVPYAARRLHGVDQHPSLQGGNKDGILISFQ